MNKNGKKVAKTAGQSGNKNGGEISPDEPAEQTFQERAFLMACDVGNIAKIREIMAGESPPSISCRDHYGRNPFTIALERDDVDLIEYLVPLGDEAQIADVLLEAINEKKESMACAVLKNIREDQREEVLNRKLQAQRALDSSPKKDVTNQDVTPMMAAAQKNLYEVVRSLHNQGETIETPHPYRCTCQECVVQSKYDQLRFAQRRLNAYKALTSESYLSIVSLDPMKDAFRLSGEMKDIAKVEKHFKGEYMALGKQLSVYLMRLLDRVRDQSELEAILNRVDANDIHIENEAPLARLKMAIDYEEKKFVAHPSCQMKLVNLWYAGAGFLEKGTMLRRFFNFIAIILIHPFAVPLYIVAPNLKLVSFMAIPVIKFCSQTFTFVAFLAILITWSFNTTGSVVLYHLELKDFPGIWHLFKEDPFQIEKYTLRRNRITTEELLIGIWVLGFFIKELQQIYTFGIKDHFRSLYNVIDVVMIILYLASLSLRITTVAKVQHALEYFNVTSNFAMLEVGDAAALSHYYWLNPDRYYWDGLDPTHVSEGIFAIANVFTFSRISYVLPVNELLGPLQISLGRMFYDISKFAVIFIIVFLAFLIGLNNLFWYYVDEHRLQVELVTREITAAGKNFGGFSSAIGSVFWGMFGLTSPSSIEIHPYEASFIHDVASFLYGTYQVAIIIVLLNMLIAMMSSSFEQIEQDSDVEWKFARSKLYLQYIEEGSVLPPPLNLLEILIFPIKLVVLISKHICCSFDKKVKKVKLRKMSGGEIWRTEAKVRKLAAFRNENEEYTIIHKQLANTGIYLPPTKISYQEVVSRVVERFIFDVTSGDEAEAEDDVVDIRQDMTRLRRDVFNSMTTQEAEIHSMCDKLTNMTQTLTEIVEGTNKKVANCQENIKDLKIRVGEFDKTEEECLHMYLAITERIYHSLNSISGHLLKKPVAPDSSLTDILTFRENRAKMASPRDMSDIKYIDE